MTAEIVHDDDVAGAEGGHQELLDIGAKAGAVDRPVDDAGGGDAVVAQGRQKGQGVPATVRHLGDQPRAAAAAPVPAGHVGLGPGLVDKHQAPGVKPALMAPSTGSGGGRCRRDPARWRAGFFLNVMPSCLKQRHTAP